NHDCGYYYEQSTDDFSKIPGNPVAYWVSDKLISTFVNSKKIGDVAQPKQGLATANTNKYLRLWYEVDIDNIKFNANSHKDARETPERSYPYNKGGEFRNGTEIMIMLLTGM